MITTIHPSYENNNHDTTQVCSSNIACYDYYCYVDRCITNPIIIITVMITCIFIPIHTHLLLYLLPSLNKIRKNQRTKPNSLLDYLTSSTPTTERVTTKNLLVVLALAFIDWLFEYRSFHHHKNGLFWIPNMTWHDHQNYPVKLFESRNLHYNQFIFHFNRITISNAKKFGLSFQMNGFNFFNVLLKTPASCMRAWCLPTWFAWFNGLLNIFTYISHCISVYFKKHYGKWIKV